MDNLTKEQKYLLVSMYKEILARKSLNSDLEPNYFRDSNEIRDLFLPEQSPDYVSKICWELHHKGYLLCSLGDDLANDIEITDEIIIYMENRFSDGIKSITDFLLKLVP